MEDFKTLLKSLPEIPEELANTKSYKEKNVVYSRVPTKFTNFGEVEEEQLEEEILVDEKIEVQER